MAIKKSSLYVFFMENEVQEKALVLKKYKNSYFVSHKFKLKTLSKDKVLKEEVVSSSKEEEIDHFCY